MALKRKNRPHGPVFLIDVAIDSGNGRSDWIRTSDLLVPNETRYQAALRSEGWRAFYRKSFVAQGVSWKNFA
jgi:hypothetical protein